MVNLYYIIFGNRRWCQGEEEEKENKRKHVKMKGPSSIYKMDLWISQ